MPGPIDALRKASSIGPTYMGPELQGEMPMGPSIQALGRILGPSGGQILRRAQPAMETLGERLPDFTPIGGESMFNAGRKVYNTVKEPLEAAYQRIKQLRGVGPKPAVNPVDDFYRQNPPAQFAPGGGRSTGSFRDTDLLTDEPIGLNALKGLVGR